MKEHKHMKELAIVLSIALLFIVVLLTKLYLDNKFKEEPKQNSKIELKDLHIEIQPQQNEKEESKLEENTTKSVETETNFLTVYASTDLNIRTGASTDSDIYDTVLTNTKLNIADNFNIDGWRMVMYDGRELYVNGNYLSDNPVEVKKVKKPSHVKKESIKEKYKKENANITKQNKPKNTSSNKLIGKFKITHYAEDNMTSTGVVPKVGRTIAVDPNVIPYGSRIVINGHTYIAEDCGGAIKGNIIDIYVNSTEEAYRKGVYYTEVYWG